MVYLGHNNRVPCLSLVFEILCTVRYYHCEIKVDIKYSFAQVFIEVEKTFNFTNGPIKIAEKTVKTLSWNYHVISVAFLLYLSVYYSLSLLPNKLQTDHEIICEKRGVTQNILLKEVWILCIELFKCLSTCQITCFVCFDTLRPGQQFFSHVGDISSWVKPVHCRG